MHLWVPAVTLRHHHIVAIQIRHLELMLFADTPNSLGSFLDCIEETAFRVARSEELNVEDENYHGGASGNDQLQTSNEECLFTLPSILIIVESLRGIDTLMSLGNSQRIMGHTATGMLLDSFFSASLPFCCRLLWRIVLGGLCSMWRLTSSRQSPGRVSSRHGFIVGELRGLLRQCCVACSTAPRPAKHRCHDISLWRQL
jgi:hypothetical protein